MASTYLQRTQSGTETDSKKATISVWVKLGAVEAVIILFVDLPALPSGFSILTK